MEKDQKPIPSCFGDLDTVFPKGDDQLRHTPDNCLLCAHKTECLRSAMKSTGGLNAQKEFVDRAYQSGMMGFLERWMRKKDLQRKIKKR